MHPLTPKVQALTEQHPRQRSNFRSARVLQIRHLRSRQWLLTRQEMKVQQRRSTIIISIIPKHPIMHRKMEKSRITMERTRSAGRKKNFQTVSVMPFIVERAKTLHHRKKILWRHPSGTPIVQIPKLQMEPSGITRCAHKKLQQRER